VQSGFPSEFAPACMGAIAHNNKHFEVTQHLSPVFTGQGQIGKRLDKAFTNRFTETGTELIAYNNKYFEVAHHLSPVFTGQGQIGKRLETAFTPSEYKRSFQRRFVLFGMGGAGKT
jgi:hypothetical protein